MVVVLGASGSVVGERDALQLFAGALKGGRTAGVTAARYEGVEQQIFVTARGKAYGVAVLRAEPRGEVGTQGDLEGYVFHGLRGCWCSFCRILVVGEVGALFVFWYSDCGGV